MSRLHHHYIIIKSDFINTSNLFSRHYGFQAFSLIFVLIQCKRVFLMNSKHVVLSHVFKMPRHQKHWWNIPTDYNCCVDSIFRHNRAQSVVCLQKWILNQILCPLLRHNVTAGCDRVESAVTEWRSRAIMHCIKYDFEHRPMCAIYLIKQNTT